VGKIKSIFVNSALKIHIVKIHYTDCFFGDFAYWECLSYVFCFRL